MSEPFIAEIRIFAGNFAPRSWAFCDGQVLPIANNTALFSLIGTTYGGDGRTTMALPNLQGRAPMHPGRGPGLTARSLGESIGAETVTLTEAQLPSHAHALQGAASRGSSSEPQPDSTFNRATGAPAYQSNATANLVPLSGDMIAPAGDNAAHDNMQPFLALNFIIALQGLYPSRG